jgi:uncharacterized protein (TIGR02246 family)
MLPLHRTFLLALVAATLAALSCRAAEPRSASVKQDRTADEAAIRALIAANEAASNRRDYQGVAATYLVDGEIWGVGHPRISGRDAIARSEEAYWSTAPATRHITMTVESIRFLTPDVALAEITLVSPGELREIGTAVMVRRDTGWLTAAVRILGAEER